MKSCKQNPVYYVLLSAYIFFKKYIYCILIFIEYFWKDIQETGSTDCLWGQRDLGERFTFCPFVVFFQPQCMYYLYKILFHWRLCEFSKKLLLVCYDCLLPNKNYCEHVFIYIYLHIVLYMYKTMYICASISF